MTTGDNGQVALASAVSTVAAFANKCLDSFNECLRQASVVHARELSMVEDRVARFSTWAAAIGVFAPKRASMDHRLRYAPDVRDVVNGLLESLNYRILTCTKLLKATEGETTAGSLAIQDEHLKQSFIDIGTEISHLNKISNTIRRATKDSQLQKASDFKIKDDEGNDVEVLLSTIFEHHIRDRFPEISEDIQNRLVLAMILQRKRILYRRHRQGLAFVRPQQTVPEIPITMSAVKQIASVANVNSNREDGEVVSASAAESSLVKSATTVRPDTYKKALSSPSTVPSRDTVDMGNHEVLVFPSAPGLSAKRRYEQLYTQQVLDHKKETEVTADHGLECDRIKKLCFEAIGEITCPYCLHALPADVVFTGRKWEKHVKHDLDPFVCLFEECDQPDILFKHSDKWRSHMEQHCRFWRCSSHPEMGSFYNRDEYIRHLRQDHDTTLSDTKLRTLANRNARKMTKLFSTCPLCGKDEAAIEKPLESHITAHLISLSLKALPSYQEDIPDGSEDDDVSYGISRQPSRSTIADFNIYEDALERATEPGDLLKQAYESNVMNFLGGAHHYINQERREGWDASCYDALEYEDSSWIPDRDKIFQAFLFEKRKRDMSVQAPRDKGGGQGIESTSDDKLGSDNGSQTSEITIDKPASAMKWLDEKSADAHEHSPMNEPASIGLNFHVNPDNDVYLWQTTDVPIPVGIDLSSFEYNEQGGLARRCLIKVLESFNARNIGLNFRFVKDPSESAFFVRFGGDYPTFALAFFPGSHPKDWYIDLFKLALTLSDDQEQFLFNAGGNLSTSRVQAVENNLTKILMQQMLHVVGVRHNDAQNIEMEQCVQFPPGLLENNKECLLHRSFDWECLSKFDWMEGTFRTIRQIYALKAGDYIGAHQIRHVSWQDGAKQRKEIALRNARLCVA